MTSPPAYRLPAGRQGRQATPPPEWEGLNPDAVISSPALSGSGG